MFALRQKVWSPYAAGIVIGLLQIPAFLLVDTGLGASSSFVAAAGYLASLFEPTIAEVAYFSKYMTAPKYAWQAALVIGIALGAFASMRLSASERPPVALAWARLTGMKGALPRFAMAFLGGFILLLGARIAGGCTSGHGITGMAQLAVGSFAAVTAMFAGGILTAMLFRRGQS